MRFKTDIHPYSLGYQWLFHALIAWFLLNLNDSVSYWLEIQRNGPYIFNPDGSPYSQWDRFANHNYNQSVWVVILVGTGFIEANYHLSFRRRTLRFFLGSTLLAGVVFQAFLFLFNRWKLGVQPALTFGPFLAFILYACFHALLRNFVQQRLDRSEQRVHQSEAEVNALKAQINPHFFFNALNNIYGTALDEQAERTAESIEQLSGLMRYTMRQAQQKHVPVQEEMDFIRDYLQLQRVRLPVKETIRIDTQTHYDGQPARIAPLLLIPFVENAFRYGISMDHSCFLSLRLTVENRELTFVLENSVLPGRERLKGQGIGLVNVQKRLDLLYPGTHQLVMRESPDYYRVELHIQLYS
ncbi:sensor histidine kinase [Salmonirosea aquatica]|uniref:Signal transduction histidine kinase internal region domain-containing protein n=1 Tax=Salmonirosea aquatica TaxID=2654236 RepID=A0A7C9BMK9_9BACT|nr:hypothetical protein [Cytophagaceae bacterium SJW1-29]